LKKLLALNRSEIAIRILRAANELGLRTVAIYSQEDRLALHRFKADEAYLIGEGKGPVEAYLDFEGIVAHGQREGGRDPSGVGFLRENPELPRASNGRASVRGDRRPTCWICWATRPRRRRLARKAGIPFVPGTEKAVSDPKQAAKDAISEIGYPADHQGRVRRRWARYARRGQGRRFRGQTG
jgi:pyruvate carboxylase